MTDVVEFIYQHEGEQRKIMLYLHDLLVNGLNLTDKIRYRIPFYYRKSWLCYMNPLKNGNVEFAFVRGNELSNEQQLLDSKGRKQVFSVEIEELAAIPLSELQEIIQEAILLDETIPYASKRSKT